jgi:hypothetical protein
VEAGVGAGVAFVVFGEELRGAPTGRSHLCPGSPCCGFTCAVCCASDPSEVLLVVFTVFAGVVVSVFSSSWQEENKPKATTAAPNIILLVRNVVFIRKIFAVNLAIKILIIPVFQTFKSSPVTLIVDPIKYLSNAAILPVLLL